MPLLAGRGSGTAAEHWAAGWTDAASIVAEEEDSEPIELDVATAAPEGWPSESARTNPTIAQIAEAADGDPDTAARVLEAEAIAHEGTARPIVKTVLKAIIDPA